MMSWPIAFLDGISPMTMLMVGVVAVLLFGERLPEVGRSVGKQLMQLKKGMQAVQDQFKSVAMDMNITSHLPSSSSHSSSGTSYTSSSSYGSNPSAYEAPDDSDEATAPKFEPPKAEPAPKQAGTAAS